MFIFSLSLTLLKSLEEKWMMLKSWFGWDLLLTQVWNFPLSNKVLLHFVTITWYVEIGTFFCSSFIMINFFENELFVNQFIYWKQGFPWESESKHKIRPKFIIFKAYPHTLKTIDFLISPSVFFSEWWNIHYYETKQDLTPSSSSSSPREKNINMHYH